MSEHGCGKDSRNVSSAWRNYINISQDCFCWETSMPRIALGAGGITHRPEALPGAGSAGDRGEAQGRQGRCLELPGHRRAVRSLTSSAAYTARDAAYLTNCSLICKRHPQKPSAPIFAPIIRAIVSATMHTPLYGRPINWRRTVFSALCCGRLTLLRTCIWQGPSGGHPLEVRERAPPPQDGAPPGQPNPGARAGRCAVGPAGSAPLVWNHFATAMLCAW